MKLHVAAEGTGDEAWEGEKEAGLQEHQFLLRMEAVQLKAEIAVSAHSSQRHTARVHTINSEAGRHTVAGHLLVGVRSSLKKLCSRCVDSVLQFRRGEECLERYEENRYRHCFTPASR